MSWTLKTLAAWCGGTLHGGQEETLATHVTFDSRKVREGSLFVCLKGKKADGHDFVAAAKEQGAVCVLAEHAVDVPIPQILVNDSALAFGRLAAAYRKSLPVKVVGVTGSVGKTSTKEMLAAVLQSTFVTAKTLENHNNDLGLPLTILDMPENSQLAVLEMGMNHFGEMSYLSTIAQPDIAVITNIGTAHIEYLGTREGILRAKLEILEGLAKNGIAVFNGDEPLLWSQKTLEHHKKYFYGIENSMCAVTAHNVKQLDGGMSFQARGLGQEMEIFVPADGIHTVYNALAAITVGLICGVRPEKIQLALANFQNTGMRQKILQEKGMTIIADCYNAGPESMEAALNVLGDRPATGKRIAVLGDMLELGTRSMAEHYRIGRLAASKADYVLAYGTYADRILTGAFTGGMKKSNCMSFSTHEAMAEKLRVLAGEGDVLLFKGSRGMRMEHVLELFLEEN